MVKLKNQLQLLLYAISLLLRSTPILSCLFLLLIISQGLFPTFNVMISMHLVDIIAAKEYGSLTLVTVLWGVTLVAPGVLNPLVNTLQSILNTKSTWLTQQKIMLAACKINDLKHLESADIHNDLDTLSKEASHRPLNLLVGLVELFRDALRITGLSLVLVSVAWWLPLAFLLPLIPLSIVVADANMDMFDALLKKSKQARRIKYFVAVLLDVRLIKEIRLFNLAPFFIHKHTRAFNQLESELNQIRKKQLLRPQPWNLLYIACVSAALFYFVRALAAGAISAGGLLGTIQAISILSLTCQWAVYTFAGVSTSMGFFERLSALEQMGDREEKTFPVTELPDIIEIRFEDVSFHYHDGRPALKNINLTLRSGDRLALVGENGAGKSTLIKLLCRLYRPTAGRITCNGINADDIDIQLWRQKIGAIFQDFGHYSLTLRENITFSERPGQEDEQNFTRACRRASLRMGDAVTPDMLLGKEYDGTELSGGEWQRLALARALYAERELIIFDEPTSAMDPRVEAELFGKFSLLAEGKTAVMVTHRLGVVQYASRVAVLKNGEIVEQGSPYALERARGEYYALLTLQRDQYAKPVEPEDENTDALPDL